MKKYEMIKQIYKTKLPGNAKSIMVYLINRSNEERVCFPSVCTIAEDCGISERTVQRMITVLTDKGYITKKTRFLERGGQLSNLYCINMDIGQREQKKVLVRKIKDAVNDTIIVPDEDTTEGTTEAKDCIGADRSRADKTIDFQFYITGEIKQPVQAYKESRPSGRGKGYP